MKPEGIRIPIASVVQAIDKDPSEEWSAGEEVETYVPLEPYSYLPALQVKQWQSDPHALPVPEDVETGRLVQTIRCNGWTCPTTVVNVRACRDGLQWAVIIPHRQPKSANRPEWTKDKLAVPLHAHKGGHPHVQVTKCDQCGQHWLIVLFDDRVEIVKSRVHHRSRITD